MANDNHLAYLAFNMKRAINIMGTDKIMNAIQASVSSAIFSIQKSAPKDLFLVVHYPD